MTNTTEELKRIRDEAPEGACHWDNAHLKHHKNATWLVYAKGLWQMLKLSGINHCKNIRSLDDIREIIELRESNAEKDKRIAELKPSLFWDANNTEESSDHVEEIMQLKYDYGAEVGDQVEIQRATLLSNEKYVFTVVNDDGFEYELSNQAKEGEE